MHLPIRMFFLGVVGTSLAAGSVACQNSASNAAPATSANLTSQSSPTEMSGDGTKSMRGDVMKSTIGTNPGHAGKGTPLTPEAGHALAAFAEGCFWGSENTFRHVKGVTATAVGYSGGHTQAPDYETVCTHTTGHAETVLVEFDPQVVSYEKLVQTFYGSHDPTTLNRQGPDVGDQYRSAIFTFGDDEARVAKDQTVVAQKTLDKPITTEIASMPAFWIAEGYHQQYDEKTGKESCPLPQR